MIGFSVLKAYIKFLAFSLFKGIGKVDGDFIFTFLNLGYNGMPRGCNDDDMPWGREGGMLDSKYAFVCHAELNAILNNAGASLVGSKCYVTLFPCNECAKAIIQAGIKEVIYLSDKYADTEGTIASKKMLNMVGVKLTQYKPTGRKIELEL